MISNQFCFYYSGVVWTIDCSWDSTKVVTGSGDVSLNLWDLEHGRVLSKYHAKTGVRAVSFSSSGKLILLTTDQTMKMPAELKIIDINDPDHFRGSSCVMSIPDIADDLKKPTAALWGPLDEFVITGHEDGNIVKWDIRVPGARLQQDSESHKAQINDMQFNSDQTMLITASKDTTAKVSNKQLVIKLETNHSLFPHPDFRYGFSRSLENLQDRKTSKLGRYLTH